MIADAELFSDVIKTSKLCADASARVFVSAELEDDDDEIDEAGQEYLEKLERSVSRFRAVICVCVCVRACVCVLTRGSCHLFSFRCD